MPRVKTFNEEEVLIKAMNLFWKKGFHATSMQDLVIHLGINRASMYDTFGDKKALFDKALTYYRKINAERISAFFEKQQSVKNGITAFFEMGIDQSVYDAERKGCFVVNTVTELIPGDDVLLNVLQENQKNSENALYQFLLTGQKSGEIASDKDLKSIAKLIFTLQNGIKVVAKVSPNKEDLMRSVKVALSLLD